MATEEAKQRCEWPGCGAEMIEKTDHGHSQALEQTVKRVWRECPKADQHLPEPRVLSAEEIEEIEVLAETLFAPWKEEIIPSLIKTIRASEEAREKAEADIADLVGCPSCHEDHPPSSMCPPFEGRTTGLAAIRPIQWRNRYTKLERKFIQLEADYAALEGGLRKAVYQPRWIFLVGYSGSKADARKITDGDQGICTLCWAEQDSTKGWKDHSRPLHKPNCILASPHPGADLLAELVAEKDRVATMEALWKDAFVSAAKWQEIEDVFGPDDGVHDPGDLTPAAVIKALGRVKALEGQIGTATSALAFYAQPFMEHKERAQGALKALEGGGKDE